MNSPISTTSETSATATTPVRSPSAKWEREEHHVPVQSFTGYTVKLAGWAKEGEKKKEKKKEKEEENESKKEDENEENESKKDEEQEEEKEETKDESQQ